MLSVTKNVKKPNVTKNGKNDQIYDMKLNERVKKSYLLNILYNCIENLNSEHFRNSPFITFLF